MGTRVSADQSEARRHVDNGDRVVLILPPDTPAPDLGADPAHLAYFVGDAGDPAVQEAAEAMAADLWPSHS
jgi:hypothetical protein